MRRALFGLALAAATLLFLVPTLPSPPDAPGLPFDKAAHVAVLAGLALLARRAWPATAPAVVFLALVAYAAAIELVQPLTGRAAEWLDLAAGAAGALAAFVLPRGDRR